MVPSEGKWVCNTCEKTVKSTGETTTIITERREDREILVVDEKTATLPKTKAECPKCGHNEAYWVLRQTRAADEPETRIYRCIKCEHSWREY
jgi:DNA-directed RNA polymerase subunit M